MRVQIQRLTAAMGAASIASVVFNVTNVKAGNFSVKATVVDNASTPVSYEIADANGKVRAFAAVDDFVKSAVKYGVINGTSALVYTFAGVTALEPAAFTGDMTKRATTQLASLVKQDAAAAAELTNLDAQIALFPSTMTAGETLQKAERQAQRDCVAALRTWIASEQTRINLIINP